MAGAQHCLSYLAFPECALTLVQIGLEKGREEGVQIGLTKGREEGREEGLVIGKIQLLEQLLGESPTPTHRLSQRSLDELNLLLAQLQERLRSRGE